MKGDVSINAVHIVKFPANAFHQTIDVPVLTVAALTKALLQSPQAANMGPFAAGHADMEMIQTRNLMYMLAKYAPLFLNSRGDTLGTPPRMAWDTLMPLLTQDNCLIDCQVLVNWL